MHRRFLLIGLLTAALTAQAALPQRNLLVQWRVVSSQSGQQGSGGLRQGEVVVDSRRGVSGSASVGWSTTRSQGTQDADGQLLVLNGARASLNLSQTQPLTVWQWAVHLAPSPQGSGASRPTSHPHHPPRRHDSDPGPALSLWSDTVWVERGQGVRVRPRWSGGRTLVELELEADLATSPSDTSERTSVSTTLGLPLGEWSTVARTGAQQQGQRSGAWHSSTAHSEAQSELQIRISLP